MKGLFVLLFCFLGFAGIRASDPVTQLDSLYRIALKNPSDSTAIANLNSFCSNSYSQHTDTVRWYSEEQTKLASKAGNKHYEARGYIMWGICMEIKGNLDSALVLYTIAEEIGEQTDDNHLLMDVYNNKGIVYSYQGLFELSVENTLKALELAERYKDKNRQAALYNNLGLRYSEMGNQALAIENLEKAAGLNHELGQEDRLTSNYVNLGNAYYKLNRFEEGLKYAKLSAKYAKAAKRPLSLNIAYSSLALQYTKIGDLEKGKAYVDSARSVAAELGDNYGLKEATMISGVIAKAEGNSNEAIRLLEEALEYFNDLRYLSVIQDIRMELADLYQETGRYQEAYRAMKEHAMAKDSLFNEQKDKAMRQVAIYKEARQEREKELLEEQIALRDENLDQEKKLRNAIIGIGVLLLLLLIGLAQRYRFLKRTKRLLTDKNELIEKEKARSDELLLNILPASVAEELKATGVSEAKDFDEVTVIFTDFAEFTKTSQRLTAKELVEELNTCFKAFDEIITKYRLEKIKTIGDAYMAASGLHTPKEAGASEATLAALEMQEFMNQRKLEREAQNLSYFEMRCGMNTGPVVAGIVGVKKFQFDIWGDTVNTASRMESLGAVGKVNISEETYSLTKNDSRFSFENRGRIAAKGKGDLEMWFVSKNSEG